MCSDRPKWFRLNVLNLATRVQSASALSFSAFLALHLAAPLAAALGADASGVMLLTREYYQTSLIEPILVWGSLAAHVLSGLTRRALLGSKTKRFSLHSIAGFVLIPVALGHSFTHRILPARKGISPSLLSYQFVSYSLFVYPFTSWTGYGVLILAASYHATGGLRTILSGRKKAARLPDSNAGQAGYAAAVGALGLGLVNLAFEGKEVPLWLARRYAEVVKAAYKPTSLW
ncbi:MAG: hypothetical protein CYPHOPRED_005313 [Cyphobasidiales sp. Tagirdzhanova-0007]|nr:MAG: hypothetical protein CYPHOPRED_005313 [Cyphobasidiales sp. Tagirdzhanova-0007]